MVLNDLRFRPCQACGGCDKTGLSILNDGMLAVHEAVKSAGGLVLASPIHFGTLSARTKMAIDRFQCFWAAKYLLRRPWIGPEEDRISPSRWAALWRSGGALLGAPLERDLSRTATSSALEQPPDLPGLHVDVDAAVGGVRARTGHELDRPGHGDDESGSLVDQTVVNA